MYLGGVFSGAWCGALVEDDVTRSGLVGCLVEDDVTCCDN
jgi:hypothetical protein